MSGSKISPALKRSSLSDPQIVSNDIPVTSNMCFTFEVMDGPTTGAAVGATGCSVTDEMPKMLAEIVGGDTGAADLAATTGDGCGDLPGTAPR